jgi:hypothetical protein
MSTLVPRGKQIFISNGTFTVPDGVTTIYVSGCGGGGGGGEGNSGFNGTTGGTTSLGSLLSLPGGGGGGAGAGAAGAAGGTGGTATASTYDFTCSPGGSSLFGCSVITSTKPATTTTNNGYGSGGLGLFRTSDGSNFRGGGGAKAIRKNEFNVIPGTVYTVTIGIGGSNPVGYPVCKGSDGFILIEW